MHKNIVISVEPQEKRIAVIEDGRLQEYYAERQTARRLVGNIYKGKVTSIVKGIGAAFVDMGTEKNGFLYVSDMVELPSELRGDVEPNSKPVRRRFTPHHQIADLLKKDQEILVQVTKDPLGTKGPRLTAKISLPGRYCVLMPTEAHRGISKRISDEKERKRIRDLLGSMRIPPEVGLIVRTVGEKKSARDFLRDLRYLLNIWKRINAQSKRAAAPSLLYKEQGIVYRILRDVVTESVDKIAVDSKADFRDIHRYVSLLMPQMKSRLQLHKSPEPIFEKYHIEDQIEKIYYRKVELKGGGYLIIEPTESLVAIDVNSGRSIRKKSVEDTAFSVNMEAAGEIPRQIKLRDLGGIIIIDFIDMESAANRIRVYQELEEALKSDKAKVNILRISEIGVVEMTRQRRGRPLESLSYQLCPYCQGRGSTKSAATMAIITLRKLKTFFYRNKARKVSAEVHPDVASRLFNEDRNVLVSLERSFGARVIIRPNASYHIEHITITQV